MKKNSNSSLFFMLGIGIVGLGLYYSATKEYGTAEIQLYHFICWVVLLLALLRTLELIWEPIRALWDHAWGKISDAGIAREEQAERGRKERFFYSEGFDRMGERTSEGMEGERDSGRTVYENSVKKESKKNNEDKSVFCGESVILDEQGRRVIIVPDSGPRLSLGDRCTESRDSSAEPGSRYVESDADVCRIYEPMSNGAYNREVGVRQKNGDQKKDQKKNGKKKKKAKA